MQFDRMHKNPLRASVGILYTIRAAGGMVSAFGNCFRDVRPYLVNYSTAFCVCQVLFCNFSEFFSEYFFVLV